MNPVIYESASRDPELIQALMEQARRERAEAMHRLIVQPIKKLFARHATRANLGHPRKASGAAA